LKLKALILISLLAFSTNLIAKESIFVKFGAWVVYWDFNRGYEELRRFGQVFDKTSLFAYEIDSRGFPVRAKELTYSKIKKFVFLAKRKKIEPWLTLVNDVRLKNGRVLLKESFPLKKLFSNKKLTEYQINSIIHILKKYGFKGIDIDFEKIPENLSEKYGNYITKLIYKLKEQKLGCNVIVEPYNGPLPYWGTANLTVMSYNLHWSKTLPGPRSTSKFIKEIVKRVEGDAKGSPGIAIVLKGFLWERNGKVRRVDFSEGENIKINNPGKIKRDEGSKIPFIKFENGDELWYDDVVSLKDKIKTSIKAGYKRIMFWYLGGNPVKFFYLLNSYKKDFKGANK